VTVISVCEYETLPIVDTLANKEQRALTREDVDWLYILAKQLRIRLIEHVGLRAVRFRQFVGLVAIDKRQVEILPKLESSTGDEPTSVMRHNLLRMLLTAHDTEVHSPGQASSTSTAAHWLDVFVAMFCRTLSEQTARGLTKEYREEQDDLYTVRGQILLDQQVTRNVVHRERIACEYDELDENNDLNQVFKLALVKMHALTMTSSTQKNLRELLVDFDRVSLRAVAGSWWGKVRLTRLNSRFRAALDLAILFLDGLSPDVTGGSTKSVSLIFDMNELFERYIGRLMRRQLNKRGLNVRLQDARHYLARWSSSTSDVFMLKPDIVVCNGQATLCIADTKWKRLAEQERKMGIAQADLYQMLAYAERYSCSRVLLLYPFQRSSHLARSVERLLEFQHRSITVLIGQVALGDLSTVPSQLDDLFSRAVGTAAWVRPPSPAL
jgi:5-methylcytosine-specific restriction enzyme subunit McrC